MAGIVNKLNLKSKWWTNKNTVAKTAEDVHYLQCRSSCVEWGINWPSKVKLSQTVFGILAKIDGTI